MSFSGCLIICTENLFLRDEKNLLETEEIGLQHYSVWYWVLEWWKDKWNTICVQMHMLNWSKCFISSLHYRELNRIYVLKFCQFKVYYGNCFWVSHPKEAVEHIVTAMALLLKTPCALGQHPLRHWYLMSKAVLIHCIRFLLLRSILFRVQRDELSVLVFRIIHSLVCIFFFSL